MISKTFTKRLTSRAAVVLEAAALCLGSTSAMAAVVCSSAPVSVPANLDGVYLNIATGATGTSGSGVSGWDINLYQTGASALYFFWSATPTNSYGGVATGTVYDSLTAGATVSSAQTYSTATGGGGPANFVNWQTTTAQTGRYLGVRFYNEATSAINYGWLQMDTGATNGFPATINQFCYENTGAAITTGAGAAVVNPGTVSGTTVTLPAIHLPSTTSSSPLTFTASGGAASVTCTASGAGFSAAPSPLSLTPGVPGTVTVSYSGSSAGTFTGSLDCVTTASGGPFTYPLSVTVGQSLAPTPTTIPSLGTVGLWAMLLGFLGMGLFLTARNRR